MDIETQVQILDKIVFISFNTTTLVKVKNSTILPLSIDK